MPIKDLQKAVNILMERGHTDILIEEVVPGDSDDILAVFYTVWHTKLCVHKSGLITEYEVFEEEEEPTPPCSSLLTRNMVSGQMVRAMIEEYERRARK